MVRALRSSTICAWAEVDSVLVNHFYTVVDEENVREPFLVLVIWVCPIFVDCTELTIDQLR